jgi:hypothetical protein
MVLNVKEPFVIGWTRASESSAKIHKHIREEIEYLGCKCATSCSKTNINPNGHDMNNNLKREPIPHNLHYRYVHHFADEHFKVPNLNITSNHQNRGKVQEQPTSLEYNCEDIPTTSRRQVCWNKMSLNNAS